MALNGLREPVWKGKKKREKNFPTFPISILLLHEQTVNFDLSRIIKFMYIFEFTIVAWL